MKKKITVLFFSLLAGLYATGQSIDNPAERLIGYVGMTKAFSDQIPQEQVYIHLDNTGYYHGDNIWFQCYVTLSPQLQTTPLSRTLYVELLNPGGETVEKKILKIENGRCHGDFSLNRLPFYSGFYEIRAYTKYMLNFGEDVIFSRLIPVFDKPREEGRYEEKNMQLYGKGKYPMFRPKPPKRKKVNLRFFPEGGNLVAGVPSEVAFEATDSDGNPIAVEGTVTDDDSNELARIAVTHEGRGVFTYTPGARKPKAVIAYENKTYKFDLPEALPQGYVMQADNLSDPDSIGITIRKNTATPDRTLGVALLHRGCPYTYCLVDPNGDEPVRFKFDKTGIPSGVARLVLFDDRGVLLADRLLFTGGSRFLRLAAQPDKTSYEPLEAAEIAFTVSDPDGNPVQTPFSVAVRDGTNEVIPERNILTDLLLTSEIKGYVHRPAYYFEADDDARRAALDLLLRVQGWRRYSWEQMAGVAPFDWKYLPEQHIEVHGRVVSAVRKAPKGGVQISVLLSQKDENESGTTHTGLLESDSLGHFSFASDLESRWYLVAAVTEKGKKKNYKIMFDRYFSPEPRPYEPGALQIAVAEPDAADDGEAGATASPLTFDDYDMEAFLRAYEDSLARLGIDEKIHRLGEVTVTADKDSREKQIYRNRQTSVAYYDIPSEWDVLKDQGEYVRNDVSDLLRKLNPNFVLVQPGDQLLYKGKTPLFVVNYSAINDDPGSGDDENPDDMDALYYTTLRMEAVKSVYINESFEAVRKYTNPSISSFNLMDKYSCVVFIETYPEGKIPAGAGKGVRKTRMEGYTPVRQFLSPDYSVLPPEPDYRRTLYWNPSVVPDSTGRATIRFYNNSTCRRFEISAETLSPDGTIGLYREEE